MIRKVMLYAALIVMAAIGSSFAYSAADLVFSVDHNDLGAAGSVITAWGTFTKTGNTGYDPTVATLTDAGTGITTKWAKPAASTLNTSGGTTAGGSGFTSGIYNSIPNTGFTIVAAIIPSTNTLGGGEYRSIVNAYMGGLGLYQIDTGKVSIRLQTSYNNFNTFSTGSAVLTDGKPTVLSMVVSNTGAYEVWMDTVSGGVTVSTQVLSGTSSGWPTGNLLPSVTPVPTAVTNRCGIGLGSQAGTSSPSGTTFRGYIGDTYLYKTALTSAERIGLVNTVEKSMGMLPNGPTHTITASAGANGTISPSGAVVVNEGTNQTFTIAPNAGYKVEQVTVDGVGQGAITSYTFNGVVVDHTISVTFVALPTFTITASATSDGTITPSGAVTVSQGANQTFTIAGKAGFQVAQVVVDDVNQGAITSYTFSGVTANHTISATFTPVPTFTINASAGAGGTITPSGAVVVNQGSNQLFTITPNSGYVVADVLVDSVSKGAITSFTFSNVTTTHTISVTFTDQPPAPAGLVFELRPQDFTGTQWPIYQGSLKDANPSQAYFAANGTPKYVPNIAGTKHSGIGLNNNVWDVCLGLGGPIAPASITGTNPRTIEVWSYNPVLAGEETLVDLSHRGSTAGQHFALENGNNWALSGNGTGDVSDWSSSIRQNRWVHLVVTYASGVATFYVDGAVTTTKNLVYDVAAGDSISIGSQRTAATTGANSISNLNSQVYIGYIGNIRVYEGALSAAEVASRFSLGVNGGETDATTYTVSGRVTDGTNGIASALVYFGSSANASLNPTYVATTDASGNYTQSLPAGTWYIAAAKGRYIPHPTADTQVVLASNQTGVNFTLTYVTTPTKLLDVDASLLAGIDNDPVDSWTNAGTLGGTFSIDGSDQTTRPVLATVIGRRCVQFDGSNDRLKLQNGGTAINAPAGLTGNSDWTVCGWYLNPSLQETECYLSWGCSGNQPGARCGFMYGSHNGDGGVMHGACPWLNSNMPILPLPTSGLWHHIAVTFDGVTENIYVDGVLNETENKNLKIGASEPLMMGAWTGTTTGGSPGTWYGGSIASLSVYDQVLTASEINALGFEQNYTISGSVKDNANQPLLGAQVFFSTATPASSAPLMVASTDASGNFTQQVPPGNWYISAMKSRYTPNPAPDLLANVTTANVTGKNFVLTPDATLHKLIDLDASGLSTGVLSSWANTGSLGGSFAQDGTDPTTNPTVTTVAGKKAVTFDGSVDRLKATFAAPAGMTSGSDWTVSAMIYNPSVGTEEAYLCWAQRGTAPRAAEFSYGSDYCTYHASNNLDWIVTPPAATWHHVAVTYDGSAEKVYVDGLLTVQSTGTYLNLWTGQPVFLGCAFDNATATTKSKYFSGSLASVQVYDEALTQLEVRDIATVTISGKVTGPSGNSVPGAIVGFKSMSKTTAGLAVAAAADADIYVLTDGVGNYSLPILKGDSFYVAAWKDGYTPSDDTLVTTNASQTADIAITNEAGVNMALGRTASSGRLYASPTGIGSYSVNRAFDGSSATYFSWNTGSQKDLVIDVSKSNGVADSINAVTLITDSYKVYDWELWVEDNAAPIVGGAMNTSANWTKVYQSTGSFGGYDRTAVTGQVLDPVAFAARSARGVWIKITSGSSNETRLLEVNVHSSGAPLSIGSCKTQPDGTYVVLSGKSVTWAPRDADGIRTTNYCYVEDLGRISGIRIQDPLGFQDALEVYDMVSIAGVMATDPDTQERYIDATITPSGTPGPGVAPFAATTKAVQTDAKLIGQLVSVSGKVKQVAIDGSWFAISDGFVANGAEQTTKVIVKGIQLPANLAAVNDNITVIGVVSRELAGDGVHSVISLFNYNKTVGTTASNEVTFFTVSDIHYGKTGGTVEAADQATVDMMDALPGNPYPSSIGGYVQTPRGVVEIGDIAEGGTAAQFDEFVLDYGLNGEARLRYPVFEGLGNHDGRINSPVGLRIQARNLLRRGLTAISSNGIHYSWDWNGVHFVHCNLSPTDVNEGNLAGDPNYALQFLKEDLPAHVGNSGRPVIIFQHYGFESFSAGWWSENERTNYYNVIKDYNVVAIMHGHTHTAGNYKWNGIDVYQDGSGQKDPDPGGFFVVRVRPNQLSVAQRTFNVNSRQWEWGMNWTKSITSPNSTAPESQPANPAMVR